jgi:hypothetical protein
MPLTKKVVGVFVRFRAPLQLQRIFDLFPLQPFWDWVYDSF